MKYQTIYFNGKLRLLDQTKLPNKVEYVDCRTQYEVYSAIKCMQVRGAPAIGIAAAYGLVLAIDNLILSNGNDPKNWDETLNELKKQGELLKQARPTAVNLSLAVDRILQIAKDETHNASFSLEYLKKRLLHAANNFLEEEQLSCRQIGKFGSNIIANGMQILTYCNAGALAAPEIGTALSPLYVAHNTGKKFNVYVSETRPRLQGSRLTAWELKETGIEPTIICDNMIAQLMKEKRVDIVIVGADRIAKNGDVANKIGTYGLAILAKHHQVPFYVAAPISTFDLQITDGKDIVIEQRHPSEVSELNGSVIAPEGVAVYNPSFDVTPHDLITGIISDHGLITPVNAERIEKTLAV